MYREREVFCVKTCTLLPTNKLNTASSICNCIADRQRPGAQLMPSEKSCSEVLFTLLSHLSLKVGLLESTGLVSIRCRPCNGYAHCPSCC